jgi:D-erythronate 2-dehydrogenase
MTRLLITGGAGFIGARLARTLLARRTLAGREIEQIALADQFAPPEDLLADRRVRALTGPLLEQCAGFAKERVDGVFHLASAVSGECELDFDLGMRSNLDSTRALLDALRAAGNAPRLVFSSSVAVFGPDPGKPLADVVADDTLPAPQTSYGTQKLMCEHLIADMTRKGFIDGRAAVRPGKPNAAASSFFSGVIREPLAGVESICPVDATVSHPVSSPARTIEALIAVYEATREQLRGRLALNLPALNVTVQRMLDALEAVAGPKVRALVTFQRDERIAGIVANWPKGASAARANALGLTGDASFEVIVRQYIADCRARPDAHLTLKGLDS